MSTSAAAFSRTISPATRLLARLGGALALGLAAMGAQAATATPAQRFDLSHWTLTLPVNSAGLSSGSAVTVLASQLTMGYSSRFFYTGSDGGVNFYVPAVGALTDTASSPRTELREQIQPPYNSVDWYVSAQSYLDATVAVNKVPASSGKVIVGQVHATNAGPMVKIYFSAGSSGAATGKIFGQLTTYPNGAPRYSTWLLASNVSLNEQFTYNITVTKGLLKMSVNGGAVSGAPIDASWGACPLYFKAGAYPKSAGKDGDDSRVTFYSVLATHI